LVRSFLHKSTRCLITFWQN